MIISRFRKILSGVVLATYLMIYTAPIGLCAVAAPVVKGSVNRPALRSAAPAPSVSKSPSVLKLEGDINISKGNPRISLSLRDSDVKQVLRMFADKAGLNIVFHSSVDGKVTLDLVNMPLNDAFKLVMQVSDLTYYVDHNTMVVASASAAQGLNLAKQSMISIPVKYVDASTIANFLNTNIFAINKPGLSNAQIAVTNPGTNEILIFGTENDYRMAKKIVDKFDVKPISETYVVNHTTPKEMAELLCNVLFPAPSGGSGSSSGGSSSGSKSSSSSSSKSSSSSGGSSTGGASTLTLGAGVVACSYDTSVSAGSLASLGAKSLSITYFDQHGSIEVSGASLQQLQLIKEFIAKNDKKQPQAYLEVSLVELSESGSQTFQNTWRYWSEGFSADFNGGSLQSNPLYPTFLQGDGFTMLDATDPTKILYQVKKFTGTPTLSYAINYLVENKKGRLLANPRILITNGELSTIDLTSDYVKKVTSQQSGTGLTTITTRTYDIANDDGIKVEMTPFISPDGYVTMNIKPQYSVVKEKVWTQGTKDLELAATLLSRRNLELKNVRIKDGETLVIGGMIKEDEQKTVQKLPFLGDLPGLGFFFRNSATTKTKQELVIMITPKIIKDTEDVVNNSDSAL